ncbi:MAG: hypothetical protein SFY92_01020 [Verrucomicrobiae bacterium]|nr:hypothetical protein [Verrucomicrobiae bacterium]
MNQELFEQCTLKMLAGEATPEEILQVETACRQDPLREREFQELREAYLITRDVLPLVSAQFEEVPELPEYRVGPLQAAVRRQFAPGKGPRREGAWGWAWPLGLAGAACVLLAFLYGPGQTELIELAVIREGTVRSAETELSAKELKVMVREFEDEKQFEAWVQKPLTTGSRARIWFDEETEVIRVERRGDGGRMVQKTYRLPSSNVERQKVLRQIVAELNGP